MSIVNCTKCGICCKLFNVLDFPPEYKALDDGSGKCKYLVGNLCSIYEDRPELCNSQWVYDNYYKDICSEEEYADIVCEHCQKLISKFGDKV